MIRITFVTFFIVSLLSPSIPLARQGRCTGTFSIGKKELPASLDAYSLRLGPERRNPAATVMVRLTVSRSFNASSITDHGGIILRQDGKFLVVSCRSDAVEGIAALDGVERCSAARRPLPQMDSVRAQCRIDHLHGGTAAGGFPTTYTGKGILTGILDSEFDMRHPAFLDGSGLTRFFAMWDQNDSTGRRNNRFGYGTIKNRNELLGDSSFGLGNDGGVHGTHTASTMAGSVTPSGYTGAAPEGTLVGVRYGGIAEIAEGIIWICTLADSLKLPCVINMSIGLSSGPHDGTSLVDRIIDSLSGPGRIIVGAVGNDGGRYSHISFTLAPGATKKTWALPQVDSSALPAVSLLGADFWGEAGKNFTGTFLVMDRRTLVFKQSGNTFSTSKTRLYDVDTIEWKDSATGQVDTFFMQYAVERSAESNGKTHMVVSAYSTNPHLQLGISITNPSAAASLTLHGWNTKKESFHNFDIDGFERGDSTFTVNEIGGTAKRNITVGAYCARTSIPQWNDTVFLHDNVDIGDIFVSSGVGPTIDGRTKPDITAPGWSVIAALSRTAPRSWDEVAVWPDTATTLSRYGGYTGTSMASPVVAGIVALLLQAKPDLTPEAARAALQKTACKDGFTGPLTSISNKWGAGKVDALAALAEILDIPVVSRNRGHRRAPALSARYSHGSLILTAPNLSAERLELSDLLGRTVITCHPQGRTEAIIPVSLAPGIYTIRAVPAGDNVRGCPLIILIP